MIKMVKKIIKYTLIFIISCLMITSIITYNIGNKTRIHSISINAPISIKNIYIDGIKEDISKYNYDLKNDKMYFTNFEIESSIISDIYLDIECENNVIDFKYDGKETKLCSNDKNNFFYNKPSLKQGIKKELTNLSLKKIMEYIFIFIIIIVFNTITINYLIKCILLIKTQSLNIKQIIITTILLFIILLFSYYILIYYFKFLPIILLFIIMMIWLIKQSQQLNKNKENYFVIIGIIFGLLMIFSLPPFHVPDEQHHFLKVYSTSNFNKNDIEFDEYGHVFGRYSKSLNEFIDKYSKDTLVFNAKYKPISYMTDMFKKIDENNISKNKTWYSLYTYKLSGYLPTIITCTIFRMLRIPIIIIFYLCRLTNLLLFLTITFYSIKKVPKYKNAFIIVSLLPITIQQACGINQDSINNTIFILMLTTIMRLIYEKNYDLTLKKVIFLLLMSIIITCCKTIYIAILLLLLLLPKEKIKLTKSKINNKKIIMLIILTILIICVMFYKFGGLKVIATKEVNHDLYTISNAIENPKHFFSIIQNTILKRFTLDYYRGLFDGFGWSTIWSIDFIKDILMVVYLFLIVGCINSSERKEKIDNKMSIINFIIIIILSGCLYYTMLFFWSSQNIDSIDGLQPRYFIPVVLLLYMEIGKLNLIKYNQKIDDLVIPVGLLIGLSLSIITIINGFI